jgi:hypothetical protein
MQTSIQEIIGKEIVDETDLYEDNQLQKRASRLIPDTSDDHIKYVVTPCWPCMN